MTRLQLGFTLLTAALAAGSASAGPIAWSYASAGGGSGGYSFTGAAADFASLPGEAQSADVTGDYRVPSMVNLPLDGPSFTSEVTITDAASGESAALAVPVVFYDGETAPEGELDAHRIGLGAFTPISYQLGVHRYSVASAGDRLLVTATELAVETPAPVDTPEPSALVLAGAGLAGVAWRRARHHRRKLCRSHSE